MTDRDKLASIIRRLTDRLIEKLDDRFLVSTAADDILMLTIDTGNASRSVGVRKTGAVRFRMI